MDVPFDIPHSREARWLASESVVYRADEAGLLDAAADRLNLSGDVNPREMARELGNAAERLRKLAGVSREKS